MIDTEEDRLLLRKWKYLMGSDRIILEQRQQHDDWLKSLTERIG